MKTKTNSIRLLARTLALTFTALGSLAALPGSARAAVIILAPTAATPGSFSITAPITFTINVASSNAKIFVLVNLATASDGAQTNPIISPGLSFSVNGATGNGANTFITDNNNSTANAVNPRDGLLVVANSFTVAVGDTVTLNTASYTIPAIANFNQQDTQTFIGNLFVSDGSGNRLSPNVSASVVPEPSTWALLGVGVAGLGVVTLRRRRSRAA